MRVTALVGCAAVLAGCVGVDTERRSSRVRVRANPADADIARTSSAGKSLVPLGRGEVTIEGAYEVDIGRLNPWSFVPPVLTLGVVGGGVGLSAATEDLRGLGVVMIIMGTIWSVSALYLMGSNITQDGEILDVRPQHVRVEASREGYAPAEARVALGPDTPGELALELRALPPRQAPSPAPSPAPVASEDDRPPSRGGSIGLLGVGGGSGIGHAFGRGGGSGGLGARGLGPARRKVVAVFEIRDEAKVIGGRAVGQATEYLRSRLASHGDFRVVPSDQLRKALTEDKKASYAACYEESCQIELGRAVAAQKSLAAKVVRLGKSCSLSLILYDLASETSERAATIDMACSADGLRKAIDEAI